MDRKLSRLDDPWASEREIDDAVSERRFVNSTVERFVHCSWIYYHVYQISDVDGAYEQLITRIGQIDPEAAGEGSAWGRLRHG